MGIEGRAKMDMRIGWQEFGGFHSQSQQGGQIRSVVCGARRIFEVAVMTVEGLSRND